MPIGRWWTRERRSDRRIALWIVGFALVWFTSGFESCREGELVCNPLVLVTCEP